MKGEKLCSALGKIDDRLVMSVVPVPVEKRRSPWPLVLTAAAVLACLLAVPQMVRQFGPSQTIDPPPVTDPEPVLSIVTVPETAEAFPATVEEAKQWGMELKTLEEWGILDSLLQVYSENARGSFPYWSADLAMERLQEGYGYCAMKEPDPQPLIYQIGLVEFCPDGMEHTVPYYWFSVELEDGQEGLYFLPAIYDSFLTCTARWKVTYTMTMEEKIMALPDPNNVGIEAKRAFAAFMKEQDLEQVYLNYDMELETAHMDGVGEFAVLRCRGPVMVGRSDQQSFHYDYGEGTVSWGASGTWYSPQTDLAENIRQMLLYRDVEDAGSQWAYDSLVREAFVQYFIENPNILWYLPEFDAQNPPDMTQLQLFAVLCGGLNAEVYTQAELDAAVARLMEGVHFAQDTADAPWVEDRIYTELPYGLPYDPVYYRPEACVWNAKSNTWTLTLSGYGFSEGDFLEDSTEFSDNWKAAETYYLQNHGIDRETLQKNFKQWILLYLYEEANVPEDTGMKATETLTVTFRLQSGDDPLRFVSCKREILS